MPVMKRLHFMTLNGVALTLPLIRFAHHSDINFATPFRAKQAKQFHLLYDFVDYNNHKLYSFTKSDILYGPEK